MTDQEAEHIISRVLDLGKRGIKEDEQMIEALKKEGFEATEESFHWVFEMIRTAAFRAEIISSGKKYPTSNLNIEDDPILKNAFRMYWIESKGADHYKKYYLKKHTQWWKFWEK